jgi:hypothetical protein
MALEIAHDNTFTFYELSTKSCQQRTSGTIANTHDPHVALTFKDDAVTYRVPYTLSFDGQSLVAQDSGTSAFTFDRVDALPAACTGSGGQPTFDPVSTFDAFAAHMAEQYAFFELRGVDWNSQVATSRARVGPATSPAALFTVMSDAVAPLNDWHTTIHTGAQTYSRGPGPNVAPHSQALFDFFQSHYMHSATSHRVGNDLIAYQTLPDGVGHVVIVGMMGFTDGTAPDPVAAEIAAAEVAVDQVLSALQDAPSIIVDVRLNGGGLDAVSLALANRFADQRRLVFTKHANRGDVVASERAFYIEPKGATRYHGKVTLLTSELTISAGETFVLAMRTLPNVTVMGDRTAGALSDALERTLPNGWQLTLSNEVYTAADGNSYEAVGVPPSKVVPLAPAGFATGHDNIFEAARAR